MRKPANTVFLWGSPENYPNYRAALESVGLRPVAGRSLMAALGCGGLLLPGGGDIHGALPPEETFLLRAFWEARRPILGICRGMQALNVFRGGTLRSGVPNAITVFNELRSRGYEPAGIRLDSGDLAYLTKKARKMLDEAGFENAKICVSGDLDETLINSLKMQGACINTWGVGTKLITSNDKPALGGVYKMSAEIIDGVVYPKIKLSENAVKITNPGIKTVYRLYDKDHMAIADLIALRDEKFDTTKPLTIYHPEQTYKRMTLTDYTMRELLVPIFIDGKQVYNCPTIQQIQAYAKQELDTLWEESKRLMNPQVYKVDYSDGLYDLRQKLIREHRKLPANA